MKLKPSSIFEDYWQFAFKRQEVLRSKYGKDVSDNNGLLDPIIQTYKFTNCYRSTDRVSQYLINHVIYTGATISPDDTFLRVILFKLFNKIETWEWLESELGEISRKTFSIPLIARLLEERKRQDKTLYSAAYIMPSGKNAFGCDLKHQNHLLLLESMLRDELDKRIWECDHLEQVYQSLLYYPSIGPFLAMQYAIDLAYTPFAQFEESDFIMAGPGALRGIKKCFDDIGTYSASDVIAYMAEHQQHYFERYGLAFKGLKNRSLQLIDCQNLFCEFDKYCRAKYPDKVVGNVRIKQKYQPHSVPFKLAFPPKWNTYLL